MNWRDTTRPTLLSRFVGEHQFGSKIDWISRYMYPRKICALTFFFWQFFTITPPPPLPSVHQMIWCATVCIYPPPPAALNGWPTNASRRPAEGPCLRTQKTHHFSDPSEGGGGKAFRVALRFEKRLESIKPRELSIFYRSFSNRSETKFACHRFWDVLHLGEGGVTCRVFLFLCSLTFTPLSDYQPLYPPFFF